MQFNITGLGSIQREMNEARDDFGKAMHRGMKSKGERLKNALRADVAKSGIKNAGRVSKTWRGTIYPSKPGTLTPAYVVSNKAPWIFESLEKGPVIRFKGGGGLIPVGIARRVKLGLGQSRVSIVQKMRAQYGEFVSVKTRKGIFLGAYIDGPKGKKKFLPLFKIVREVKSPDLLNAEGIANAAFGAYPDDMMIEVSRVYDELQARR